MKCLDSRSPFSRVGFRGNDTMSIYFELPQPEFKETAMMDRAVHEFERAKGRMAGDLRTMIADSEDLLNAAATV